MLEDCKVASSRLIIHTTVYLPQFCPRGLADRIVVAPSVLLKPAPVRLNQVEWLSFIARVLRALGAGLLMVSCWTSGTLAARAGCHYGSAGHRQFVRSDREVGGHARDFQFLGQWIYEGGDIKYVPREDTTPCHGPNCQARKERPSNNASSQLDTHRTLRTLVLLTSEQVLVAGGVQTLYPCQELRQLAGYPSRLEHPPRRLAGHCA